MQKYEREEVKYVRVDFCKPFIQYERRKPSLEEQWVAEQEGYLTPFRTRWMRNPAESGQEQPCSSIVTSFKPNYQRGKFGIPQNVAGARHERDVRSQLLTLEQDWIERGILVDTMAT
jgi:hypothetical protein